MSRKEKAAIHKVNKPTEAEKVVNYMTKLEHPLKAEIEVVRTMLKSTNPDLQERIKWNAPSYHLNEVDLVTFNHRMTNKVHLVFHHIAIVAVKSDLLEGDFTDRRMLYFENMADIEAKKGEFDRIMKEYYEILSIK
jgi:uncharacterized protein YdhG (YjbR/CyaY superfamily)